MEKIVFINSAFKAVPAHIAGVFYLRTIELPVERIIPRYMKAQKETEKKGLR